METEATLWAEADEVYAVTAYYDRFFGSFALVSEEIGAVRLTGLALGGDGKPVSRQRIELRAGGRTYITVTDAEGRYAFRARAIPGGKATLVSGKNKVSVNVSAKKATSLDVRL